MTFTRSTLIRILPTLFGIIAGAPLAMAGVTDHANLVAIDYDTGNLFSVSTDTGIIQLIGDPGIDGNVFALATFDTIISIFIAFAIFALIMATTGIYGVISFAVSQRTQEIGIRMALGAHGGSVVRMITRQAMWLVGIGVVAGLVENL